MSVPVRGPHGVVTAKRLLLAEVVLVPLGLGLPSLLEAIGIDLPMELGISLMMLVAFGAVPFALFLRLRPPLQPSVRGVRGNDNAGRLVGGGIGVLGFGLVATTSGMWGLTTLTALTAACFLAFALERVQVDADSAHSSPGSSQVRRTLPPPPRTGRA